MLLCERARRMYYSDGPEVELRSKHLPVPCKRKVFYQCRYVVKPGSQYIARDASRPEVILFSMGFDASRRKNRNRFYSCGTTRQSPLKKE